MSIYIDPTVWGRGVGSILMENLVRRSEVAGVWTLQTGIFSENEASIRLHERADFRIVGIREKLRQMNGVWRDVVLMERRASRL